MPGVYNVKDSPYSAPGDAVKLLDAVVSSGSHDVTSASANFVDAEAPTGDVGKVVWGTDVTGAGVILPVGQITAVNSATSITCSTAGTANVSGACVVFGTDGDQTAFEDAFDATVADYRGGSDPGLIKIPAGGYILSARWYRNNTTVLQGAPPDVVGDGINSTQFYLRPDFTVPGGTGTLLMEAVGVGFSWRDFLIDGCYASFATGAGQPLVRIAQAASFSNSRFDIRNIGLGHFASFMMQWDGCRQFHIDKIVCQNLGIIGTGGGMLIDDCGGLYTQCFSSNTLANLRFVNCKGRTPITVPLNWIGGGSDEGGTPAVSLVNSDVNMSGVINFSGIDEPAEAFNVDATSRLYLHDSSIGRFLGYAGPSRPLNNAGLVVSSGNTWRGNTSPPGTPLRFMINSGVFVDAGGNNYERWTDDTHFVQTTPDDCFDGNQLRVNGSWNAYNQPPT